jgi:hypothetical protein
LQVIELLLDLFGFVAHNQQLPLRLESVAAAQYSLDQGGASERLQDFR